MNFEWNADESRCAEAASGFAGDREKEDGGGKSSLSLLVALLIAWTIANYAYACRLDDRAARIATSASLALARQQADPARTGAAALVAAAGNGKDGW